SQFVNRLSEIQRPTLPTPDGVSLSLTLLQIDRNEEPRPRRWQWQDPAKQRRAILRASSIWRGSAIASPTDNRRLLIAVVAKIVGMCLHHYKKSWAAKDVLPFAKQSKSAAVAPQ
ncbi:hypothetical protein ACC785_34125, partial [Rhizobium ruizarguesonis]